MTIDEYCSPLKERYSSYEMLSIFSKKKRALTFRYLWFYLAKAQKKLGLNITNDQLDELESNLEIIDYEKINEYEMKFHHDVMAHLYEYSDHCKKAKPIIHLGATSCYLTDNADLIIYKEALIIIKDKLKKFINILIDFAKKNKDIASVGYTHMQVAQVTTIGKRICLYIQDLDMDYSELNDFINNIPFLGVKGATGSQASFLYLFDKNEKKVKKLDEMVAQFFGFKNNLIISSQTYPRKIDVKILNILSNIAISMHKIFTDVRLMHFTQELLESFAKTQVGSSAMAYKKNPIYSERICSLSRFVISLSQNPKYTASLQWFERTLDDSANRRLCMPESFLTIDAILDLSISTFEKIYVNKEKIEKILKENLDSLITENLMMLCVKKGLDRQIVHEIIKNHSLEKLDINKLLKDLNISISKDEIEDISNIKTLIGRSASQVDEFLLKIKL
jgi:adenylosuccinate lyase